MPRISPRRSVSVAAPGCRSSQLEQHVAGGPGAVRIQIRHLPPDHHLHDRLGAQLRRRPAADVPPVAQHDDAVGDGLHLLDEVRDVDDRQALCLQPANQPEQPLHVVVRQAARRFVEHDDARAAGDGAADLDQLLRRGREGGDHGVGPDLGVPELLQRRRGTLPHGPPLDQTVVRRLGAEGDVLHHAQVRRQRQFLVDHGDAGGAGIERLMRRVGGAVEQHAPGVGPDDARQDPHQRALAGAVLPDERAHLPRGHGEVHAVHRHGGAEHLAHAAHLEARRTGRYFSHCDRSGLSSSFISGSAMFSAVAMCTPVSMRCSTGCPWMCDTSVLTAR